MKKLLIILCAFCSLQLSLHAQIDFAIEAGANYSGATYKSNVVDYLAPDGKPGFFAGLYASAPIMPGLRIGLPIHFSNEGFTLNPGNSKETRSLNYVRISPELEYRFAGKVGIHAGVSFGLKASEALNSTEDGFAPGDLEVFKNSDFGIPFGATVYLGKVYITAGYYLGLANINDLVVVGNNGLPITDFEIRNKSFQLGVGYRFLK